MDSSRMLVVNGGGIFFKDGEREIITEGRVKKSIKCITELM